MDNNQDDWEKEIKNSFLDEATQFLNDSEKCFLNLSPESLEILFRVAHNIKGTSRAVGFGQIAEFTHELENLLLKIKNQELAISESVVTVLLQCNDCLRHMVNTLKADMSATFDNGPLIHQLQLLMKNQPNAPVEPVEKKTIAPNKIPLAAVTKKATAGDESLRVSLNRLESLNNCVGELVILQTVLNQHRHEFQSPLLLKTVSQLSKITKEIQDISMSLRMVPLRQTFQKLQRVVRDTALSLDKQVQFESHGEDTEIDKTVLEHLTDPLVHMIRNAVDHGIESADQRIQNGKSQTATITVSAYHQGSHLVIEMKDDGPGLNKDKIRTKAIENGILREEEILSDEEVYKLIFSPGFTTKEEISEVSGRGIGLDVVKTNIEKLSGEIQTESAPGQGTLFRMFFPLTLAIIEGLIVTVGSENFVVPLNQVHETVKPEIQDVNHITGKGEVLNLRGETLPLFRLDSILNHQRSQKDRVSEIALVFKARKYSFAVMVDSVVRQQQVVIKQLGFEIRYHRGLVGSAILGNGLPAMILDMNELVHLGVAS